MRHKWREVTSSGGRMTHYLDVHKLDLGWRNEGYIERLGPQDYNACDMSTKKWEWRRFDNIPEAKRWLEVCARMAYAS